MPIGARALDLLQALIDQRHRVVSKAELLDQVWPGLVVEENNLQVQVSTLRKLLGSDAIATVPGLGYRFTRRLDDDDPARGEPAPSSRTQGSGRTLLGREADLRDVLALLEAERLVTVTGPGGMGKTRLAEALRPVMAERMAQEVPWVTLADLPDGADLLTHVTHALGLPTDGPPTRVRLARLLHERGQKALVIDNAEAHAQAVAELVKALREHAPSLHLLVTSQLPLKVPGEWVHRLAPLPVAAPGSATVDLHASPAVQLFVTTMQATGARPVLNEAALGQIAHLCRHLDGMPLAIELAAARAAWMGVDSLLDMLGERLHLISSPHPPSSPQEARHHTVMATLTWSHGLLPPKAQQVYEKLGLLRGAFSLPLAVACLSNDELPPWEVLDILNQLVDRSLLMLSQTEPPRYRLLTCTRQHALHELTRHQGLSAAQRQLAQAVTGWMEDAHQSYWRQPDQAWLDRHGDDLDAVRTALDWCCLEAPGQALALMGASMCLFMLLGRAAEARQRAEALMPLLTDPNDRTGASAEVRGRFCVELSRLYWGVSHERLHELAHQGLLHHRSAGHAQGCYLALRGLIGSGRLPPDEATALLADMARLEVPGWPPRLRVQRHFARHAWAQTTGQHDVALAEAQLLAWMADEAGLTLMAAAARCLQASVLLRLGQPVPAQALARQLLSQGRGQTGATAFDVHAHCLLAQAHLQQGDLRQARHELQALVEAALGRDGGWLSLHADVLALLAAHEGRWSSAARLLGHAQGIDPGMREALTGRADMLQALHDQVRSALPEGVFEGLLALGRQMDAPGVRACLLNPT